MITFASFTEEEMTLADIIVSRAMALYAEMGMSRPRLDVHMDLAAAHEKCPLDLEVLANFPDGDFGHDIGGISRHLNRETGYFGDGFLPRCARPSPPPHYHIGFTRDKDDQLVDLRFEGEAEDCPICAGDTGGLPGERAKR